LPEKIDVEDLAKAGARDPELLKTHPEILDAKADFGATPNLFERTSGRRTTDEDGSSGVRKAVHENESAGGGLE
jgi:hypothetical protein